MQITVWDLPLRLFHWLLVLCVAGALITMQMGTLWMDWHGRFGLGVVGLITFRLVWGLVGSTHSRFISFIPTYRTITHYLRGHWDGIGHNPLGALSTYALLALFGFQAVSGLFATDEIAFSGPLSRVVSSSTSNSLSSWHRQTELWLYVLIGLHIIAVAIYQLRGKKLIGPMLHGKVEVNSPVEQPKGGGVVALIIAISIAAAAVWFANGGWIPAPPPAPAPAW